jgi:hypothetical protein
MMTGQGDKFAAELLCQNLLVQVLKYLDILPSAHLRLADNSPDRPRLTQKERLIF